MFEFKFFGKNCIDYESNPMNDEVYSMNTNSQCLEHGTFKGYNYYIMSYSSHPCAYIEIPKSHKFFKMDYDDIYWNYEIECHGGLTYSEDHLWNLKDSWFIGWDYAHYGDFSMRDYCVFGDNEGKKFGLDEIRQDVFDVINQL